MLSHPYDPVSLFFFPKMISFFLFELRRDGDVSKISKSWVKNFIKPPSSPRSKNRFDSLTLIMVNLDEVHHSRVNRAVELSTLKIHKMAF